MSNLNSCYWLFCGATAEPEVLKCPRCGRKMRTARHVRILGWVLFVIGLFLVGLMGAITYKMAPLLLHPGDGEGSRFTGTADQARMILELFALVILFGLGAMFSGAWQIATGRRNRIIVFGMLALAVVLYSVAFLMRQKLGG